MKNITLPSPAKLNLFLHIIEQRPDGYHLLQTAFQFIDYCDELTFNLRTDKEIYLHNTPNNIPLENNLIYRAAKLLQEMSKTTFGIDIFLNKQLPIGAGLGGGSSNAATTLHALNLLWNLNLSETQLAGLALSLGADVPIFVSGKASWAEGIGEKLTPITLPEPWYVLLILPDAIPTRKIFSDPELTRHTRPITIQQFLASSSPLHNDCESTVRKHYPTVAKALDWLNNYATACLTGTGSCVFAAIPEQTMAQEIARQAPAPFKALVVKGCNNSPLQSQLEHYTQSK